MHVIDYTLRYQERDPVYIYSDLPGWADLQCKHSQANPSNLVKYLENRGQGKGVITMASYVSPLVFLLRPAVLLASAVLASHGDMVPVEFVIA
ncbi:hypothetical protein WJX77_011069 [Trebouxia sp. C0004]